MEMQRHLVAERLGGLAIDYQLELDRGLDGKLAWRRALEDAIGISRRALIIIQRIISVGQQATKFSEIAVRIDRRKMVASSQRCVALIPHRASPSECRSGCCGPPPT